MSSPDPASEALTLTAYRQLRALMIELPPPDRLCRLLRAAVRHCEARLVEDTVAQLSLTTCTALDALIQTDSSPDVGNDGNVFD
jgi:hypothetical protein